MKIRAKNSVISACMPAMSNYDFNYCSMHCHEMLFVAGTKIKRLGGGWWYLKHYAMGETDLKKALKSN